MSVICAGWGGGDPLSLFWFGGYGCGCGSFYIHPSSLLLLQKLQPVPMPPVWLSQRLAQLQQLHSWVPYLQQNRHHLKNKAANSALSFSTKQPL
jgi:hypothetical protein